MKPVTFTFRTSRERLDRFRYVAEYYGRSANKQLEQLMLEAIENFEKKHGAIPDEGADVSPRS